MGELGLSSPGPTIVSYGLEAACAGALQPDDLTYHLENSGGWQGIRRRRPVDCPPFNTQIADGSPLARGIRWNSSRRELALPHQRKESYACDKGNHVISVRGDEKRKHNNPHKEDSRIPTGATSGGAPKALRNAAVVHMKTATNAAVCQRVPVAVRRQSARQAHVAPKDL